MNLNNKLDEIEKRIVEWSPFADEHSTTVYKDVPNLIKALRVACRGLDSIGTAGKDQTEDWITAKTSRKEIEYILK